jgi:hypothetical protein
MIGTDSNHCQIVRDALRGKRNVNEQTFASLAILDERLERLKKFDRIFSGVKFSAAVRKLINQSNPVAVGTE